MDSQMKTISYSTEQYIDIIIDIMKINSFINKQHIPLSDFVKQPFYQLVDSCFASWENNTAYGIGFKSNKNINLAQLISINPKYSIKIDDYGKYVEIDLPSFIDYDLKNPNGEPKIYNQKFRIRENYHPVLILDGNKTHFAKFKWINVNKNGHNIYNDSGRSNKDTQNSVSKNHMEVKQFDLLSNHSYLSYETCDKYLMQRIISNFQNESKSDGDINYKHNVNLEHLNQQKMLNGKIFYDIINPFLKLMFSINIALSPYEYVSTNSQYSNAVSFQMIQDYTSYTYGNYYPLKIEAYKCKYPEIKKEIIFSEENNKLLISFDIDRQSLITYTLDDLPNDSYIIVV